MELTDLANGAEILERLQERRRAMQAPTITWEAFTMEAFLYDSPGARVCRDVLVAHALCGMFWALREFLDRKPREHGAHGARAAYRATLNEAMAVCRDVAMTFGPGDGCEAATVIGMRLRSMAERDAAHG